MGSEFPFDLPASGTESLVLVLLLQNTAIQGVSMTNCSKCLCLLLGLDRMVAFGSAQEVTSHPV